MSPEDSSTTRRDVLAIVLLPVALLLVNHQWIFSGPWRDPWIYYGHFRGLPEYMRVFTGTYFTSRLSVLLPGWIVYRLLSGLAANVVLHLLLFWLAALSFYGTALRIFGRRAALVSTLALACHPFFLDSVGENYVDGFGLAYVLGAFYFLTRAFGPDGRNRDLVIAGAFAMACISANLFYVVFLPILALHVLFLRSPQGRRAVPEGTLFAAVGAAGAFLFFSLASKSLGGRYLYFLASTSYAVSLRNQTGLTIPPYAEWLPVATWLVLPALAALAAAALLVRLSRRRDADPGGTLSYAQIGFLLFLAMLTLWGMNRRHEPLQVACYTSLLLPSLFFALAGQLTPILKDLAPERFRLVAWGTTVLLAVSVSLSYPTSPPPRAAWFTMLLALAAGLPAVLVVAMGRRGAAAALLLAFSLATSQALSHRPVGNAWWSNGCRVDRLAMFREVEEIVTAWRRVDASGALHFWFDAREPQGLLYDVVASTSLWGMRLVSTRFPEIAGGRTHMGRPLDPGMKIAILSQRVTALDEARAALAPLGLGARLLSEKRIDGPAGTFTMTFVEVTR